MEADRVGQPGETSPLTQTEAIDTPIRTVFAQTYEAVRRRVEVLRREGADKLPSEPALAKGLGVSRVTVRRVLDRLSKERLVDRRQGVGTFVRPRSRRQTLCAVVSDNHAQMFDPYKAAIMRGVSLELEPVEGLEMTLRPTPEMGGEVLAERLIEEVTNLRADGYLVTIPIRLKDCLRLKAGDVPVVFVEVNFGRADIPAVLIDHREAGRLTGRYLAERDFRRPALVSSAMGTETIRKAQGYLEGMTDILGPLAPKTGETHIPTDTSARQVREAVARLMALPQPPDAIVTTGTGEVALKALQQRGLDGRHDPQLITTVSNAALAPGTTIERPSMDLLGREAARMARALLGGESLENPVRWFRPRLVVK